MTPRQLLLLLFPFLFTQPAPAVPAEVARRLKQYARERDVRMTAYAAVWRRQWQREGRGTVINAADSALWRIK